MQRWEIEYDNYTGPCDDSFGEWWIVKSGSVYFKADTEKQAEWLADILNKASEEAGYVEIS